MREPLPSIVSQLLQAPQPRQSPYPPQPTVAGVSVSTGHQSFNDAVTKLGNRLGKRPSARGTAFYPRKRANTACQVCRARKTKCDNNLPACSYCVSVGANCIQSPIDLSSFDPASLRILGRLDDLERILQELATPLKTTAIEGTDPSTWCNPGRPTMEARAMSDYPDPEPMCAWSHIDQGDGFQPARLVSSNPTDDSMRICRVLPQRVNHIVSWSIFAVESQNLEDGHLTTASQGSCFTSTTGMTSLFDLLESDSGRMHRLLDNFFIHIHGSNPILDEPNARRMAKETIMNGIDWSPESCLTLIICSLGCLASPFGPNEETNPGMSAHADSQVLFEASQKRIGSLLIKNDLIAAQCLFLSGVYMMHLFQPMHGWRFFLQASAICQCLPSIVQARQLGPTPASPPTSPGVGNTYSQEQAVYWSAWKSERELRGDLSLPDFESHDLGSTLYPPFFPTPPIPDGDVSNQSEADALRAREAWLFYLADISLRRLTSRVCSAMLNLEQRAPSNTEFLTAMLEMIPDYESQVREWRNGLPEELLLASSSEEDSINQYVLRGKMTNFFEIIYWPFVVGSLSRLLVSMTMPAGFYEIAARGLDTQMTQIRINERGFQYRHHGCFFMIRSCTRSALVLLAAAKAGAKMPDNWDSFVLKVIKMQSYWEEEDTEVASWRALIERELAIAMNRTHAELYNRQ